MSSPGTQALAEMPHSEDSLTNRAAIAQEAAAAVDNEHHMGFFKSLKLYKKACFWSIFLSTCVIMEGFDMVMLNNLYAYTPFARKFGSLQADGTYGLSAQWQSGLSGGSQAGQILRLFLTGIVADRYGYRKSLIGALVACICFIFIIFFSEILVQLLVGEILIGIPWGLFQTTTTTYAAEVCPVHLRAYLTTYINACWVFGQLFASGIMRAMLSHNDEWGYRIPFALQWIWPVPLIIGISLAPESPWWLVRGNRIQQARKSLERLTTPSREVAFDADESISMMIHTNEMEKRIEAGVSFLDLFKKANLRRTEIVCVTMMIQGGTGSTLQSYSTYFYEQAGMATDNAFDMTIGQYGMGLLGTLVAWSLISRYGRRTLYLSGLLTNGMVLFAIGGTALAGRDNTSASWAIGSLLLISTFVYDCIVGPVCYSLVSELSSTRLRTKTIAFARNMYNCVCLITSVLTPKMLNPTAWNWGAKTAFLWAGSCFICAIWTYFRLPEPKGRTFAELDILFEEGVKARDFSKTAVNHIDTHVSETSVVGGETVRHEKKSSE
ncbi:uncharacterized protein PV06_11666 [Exophiala oligosperma]|uniref:Major facilitator superfamily (MFS) profile domain-containing protein n=1 Tax=Exophiala oligosperma TaxID=215243 RepID=A0A0D2CYC2_9EURO|nr:uncharacterized protein PV06_11666 [Exophiala oligosperma]KIW36033.1 hypothetical protein PV06_11666 [Exophiala oligosperma]